YRRVGPRPVGSKPVSGAQATPMTGGSSAEHRTRTKVLSSALRGAGPTRRYGPYGHEDANRGKALMAVAVVRLLAAFHLDAPTELGGLSPSYLDFWTNSMGRSVIHQNRRRALRSVTYRP